MWPDVIGATNAALVWLLLATAGFYWVNLREASSNDALDHSSLREAGFPRAWLLVPLVALLVRLVPMLFLPVGAGYDIESFTLVGQSLLAGEEVYTARAIWRHPYLPFHLYLIGLTYYLAQLTPIPFVVWVKVPPVLADVAITALIYLAATRSGRPAVTAAFLALLYALNPISILVSAYHGQFDAIPVFLLLLAWYYWHFGGRYLPSAVALGFAILSKTWPVVLLPVVLVRLRPARRLLLYTAVALAIPALFTLAYVLGFQSNPRPMLMRALSHTGPDGYWGLSALLAVAGKYSREFQTLYETMVSYRRWLLLAAGLFALWYTRRQPVLEALTTIILCVFVVTSGIGIQWLLWPVPFAILAADVRWLKVYSLTGLLFLLTQLYGLHMYSWAYVVFTEATADTLIRLGSIPAWVTVVLWAGHRLRQTAPAPGTVQPQRAIT